MGKEKYIDTMLKVTEFLSDNEIEFECAWEKDRRIVISIEFGEASVNAEELERKLFGNHEKYD